MFFTILFHNQFVGVAAPISFYLLLTRLLTGFPIAEKLHLLAFLLVFHRTYGERCLPGVWRKVLATLILCGVMCLVGIPVMQRRLRHA